MRIRVIADTGPLVALLDRSDQRHLVCSRFFHTLNYAIHTTWPVITEAAWLLRNVRNGTKQLLQLVQSNGLICTDLDADFPNWCIDFFDQYHDLRPQLADASLVYLAEALASNQILTIDRRDFTVFRNHFGQPFELLPESLDE